jgi:hypothetical protein
MRLSLKDRIIEAVPLDECHINVGPNVKGYRFVISEMFKE